MRSLLPFFCATTLLAQTSPPRTLQLPTLLRLGPVPATLPTVPVDRPITTLAVPERTTSFVLRADARTPMAVVQTAFDTAFAQGVERVHLLANLRDGTPGTILLALPAVHPAPTTVAMRAHRDRPGVPPESVTPLLVRLCAGWQEHGKSPFVLGIEVPGNEPYGNLLPLLAAAANAGVSAVVVTTSEADGVPRQGALALDIDASFHIEVAARERAEPQPGIAATPFGLLERAAVAAPALPGGMAGGRYGGRRGAKPSDANLDAQCTRGLAWIAAQQLPNGAFPDAFGHGGVEATALAVLVLQARGSTLEAGPFAKALQRAVGWLLARQHDDGRFCDFGPEANRKQALATFALIEAAGMSTHGPLFRGSAQQALDWLLAQRQGDGGWHDGVPERASDALSTGMAAVCVESARFFRLRCEPTTADLITWFDQNPTSEAQLGAVELFARFYAGQPRTHDRVQALTALVADKADPNDPLASYWASYALFQAGGECWEAWTKRLDAVLAAQQQEGAHAGSWLSAGRPDFVATARFVWSLAARYRYSRLVVR